MRYLYINTCANTAVAWVDTQAGEATVAEASDSRSQVEELSALVDQVRGGESGVEDARPDFVVVSRGPAPFTGLRVGLVTARTLAMGPSLFPNCPLGWCRSPMPEGGKFMVPLSRSAVRKTGIPW